MVSIVLECPNRFGSAKREAVHTTLSGNLGRHARLPVVSTLNELEYESVKIVSMVLVLALHLKTKIAISVRVRIGQSGSNGTQLSVLQRVVVEAKLENENA